MGCPVISFSDGDSRCWVRSRPAGSFQWGDPDGAGRWNPNSGLALVRFPLCLVWVGERTLFINKALKQDRPRSSRADWENPAGPRRLGKSGSVESLGR